MTILTLTGIEVQRTAKQEDLADAKTVFLHYCGPKIRRVYTVFLALLMYAEYIMMTAGARAIFEEAFGRPNAVGGGLIVMASMMTVLRD